jgi:hypothetical protein
MKYIAQLIVGGRTLERIYYYSYSLSSREDHKLQRAAKLLTTFTLRASANIDDLIKIF